MMNKSEKYEIEITDLGNNGEGIGRIDGMAVFVPEALPGDRIMAEIVETKKSFARGRLTEILSPSPFRGEPPCVYADRCGGCGLQAMTYEGQLALKKKWVVDRLERIGGVDNPKVMDVIGMEEPWRYRNKVRYTVSRTSGSEKKLRGCNLGFNRKMSHDIINCESCMLQTEAADRIAQAVRAYVKAMKVPIYDEKTGTGVLRNVVVKTAFGTGEIMVILVATERRIPAVEMLIDEIEKALDRLAVERNQEDDRLYLESLILNVKKEKKGPVMSHNNITLAGKPTIKDRLMGLDFEISPLSFYQVNPVQTEKLYKKVSEYAALAGTETVFDLYCGVGTIGLTLADKAKRVIGIESVKASIIDANRNATINGIVNAEYIHGKAEEELPKLLDQGVQADLVILDPPRAGCDPTLLAAVAAAEPSRIVYVSCDPATLARDIKILTQQGYRFVEAQPVDMFPHTAHVETCVLLSHKKSQASSPSL